MRLATWNVNSVVVRLPRLVDWLATTRPDILCIQETKVADELFPRAEVEALGYEVGLHGEGRWNGVAIISRVGLDDVARGFDGEPGYPGPEARAMSATCGGLRVWSLYVPNGRTLDSDHYAYKLNWLSALRAALAASQATSPPLVCAATSTSPRATTTSGIRRRSSGQRMSARRSARLWSRSPAWGSTTCAPRALKGRPFTYWDYRAGNFHKGLGMRIDLVLLDHAVTPSVTDAYIDRDARKGTLPSDHAPLVVDLDWPR